jgi:hypothetical protein
LTRPAFVSSRSIESLDKVAAHCGFSVSGSVEIVQFLGDLPRKPLIDVRVDSVYFGVRMPCRLYCQILRNTCLHKVRREPMAEVVKTKPRHTGEPAGCLVRLLEIFHLAEDLPGRFWIVSIEDRA